MTLSALEQHVWFYAIYVRKQGKNETKSQLLYGYS